MQDNKENTLNLTKILSGCPATFPNVHDVDSCYMWKLDYKPKAIYIAASINAVGQAGALWLSLQKAGFQVTSSWIAIDHEEIQQNAALSRDQYVKMHQRMGSQDVFDLNRSDTLIVLTDVPSTSGGLHVELGYFLGTNKRNIIVVGPRLNVFFWHQAIRWTPAADGLIEWLQRPEHGT